jgi:hypothetical protein
MKHPYFVLVTLILLLTSCSSLKNSQNNELQFVNLKDPVLLSLSYLSMSIQFETNKVGL